MGAVHGDAAKEESRGRRVVGGDGGEHGGSTCREVHTTPLDCTNTITSDLRTFRLSTHPD